MYAALATMEAKIVTDE